MAYRGAASTNFWGLGCASLSWLNWGSMGDGNIDFWNTGRIGSIEISGTRSDDCTVSY